MKIPAGTTMVATAHTHPNSNNFSGLAPGATSGDIPNAINRGLNSYVIGPNLNLQKYSIASNAVSIVHSTEDNVWLFEYSIDQRNKNVENLIDCGCLYIAIDGNKGTLIKAWVEE